VQGPAPPQEFLLFLKHLARANSDRGDGVELGTCNFSSTHRTTAFSGLFRYSPITSVTLATSSGSVENLNVSAFHGRTPYSFHA
jgi:hypothetical protein